MNLGLHHTKTAACTCDMIIIISNVAAINTIYCILRGWIKGFNSSITTIMCQVGSYRTVIG